uniref:Uncharacterized protein LOC111123328 isoform X2 n=1 Tax=Crassostrea virginica TaxID=6565 RepID=A0A8B8D0H2_CRAVI|nr:uncharacterized protein LOC111123328 isoform X2 [Crassostrea virginica]
MYDEITKSEDKNQYEAILKKEYQGAYTNPYDKLKKNGNAHHCIEQGNVSNTSGAFGKTDGSTFQKGFEEYENASFRKSTEARCQYLVRRDHLCQMTQGNTDHQKLMAVLRVESLLWCILASHILTTVGDSLELCRSLAMAKLDPCKLECISINQISLLRCLRGCSKQYKTILTTCILNRM